MDYLQPQTLGSIIRNSFKILFKNWLPIFTIFGLLLLPIGLLRIFLQFNVGEREGITIFFRVIEFLAGMFGAFPLTVVISDICIGLKPNAARSYNRAFQHPVRVIGTYLALILLLAVALILLVVPAFFVMTWYMVIVPVIVLEGLGGRAAFKRSRELGKGFYLRNLGVSVAAILLLMLLFFIVAGTAGAAIGLIQFALGYGSMLSAQSTVTIEIFSLLIGIAFAPIMVAPGVLLYYDMRARKEGYGIPQLMEDLKY